MIRVAIARAIKGERTVVIIAVLPVTPSMGGS
jgi:hypothetical protein